MSNTYTTTIAITDLLDSSPYEQDITRVKQEVGEIDEAMTMIGPVVYRGPGDALAADRLWIVRQNATGKFDVWTYCGRKRRVYRFAFEPLDILNGNIGNEPARVFRNYLSEKGLLAFL